MADIQVEHLHKSFGDFVAVKNSSFTVRDGSFFCLLGPSGCGKTTTLRIIAGLEMPTSGCVRLGGEDVTRKRASARDIAFVFQLFALYPHLNVRQNIGYPLASQGVGRAERRARVEATARILRITHLLEQKVTRLSGGDRQRVALGRAIVRQPAAFMMDEPLGALDAEFRQLMCGELRGLHDRLGATTVYVTHDQTEAMALGDMIAVMNQGIVEQLAPPREIYDRPASLFVADFIGSPPMNFLPVHAAVRVGDASVVIGGVEVGIPTVREAAGGDLVLGVRPEHVRFSDAAGVRGEVFSAEYMGTTQIITVRTEGGMVKARMASSVRVSAREQVGLALRADRLSLFDAGSGRAVRTALHDGAIAHG
jgi:multiple sugar transport system ATP-binding protein